MFIKINILINLYGLDIRKQRHKEWKEDTERAELNASLVGFSSHKGKGKMLVRSSFQKYLLIKDLLLFVCKLNHLDNF